MPTRKNVIVSLLEPFASEWNRLFDMATWEMKTPVVGEDRRGRSSPTSGCGSEMPASGPFGAWGRRTKEHFRTGSRRHDRAGARQRSLRRASELDISGRNGPPGPDRGNGTTPRSGS